MKKLGLKYFKQSVHNICLKDDNICPFKLKKCRAFVNSNQNFRNKKSNCYMKLNNQKNVIG